MKLIQCIAAAIALAVPVAASAGVLYECSVRQISGSKGWVPEKMAILVDDAGSAQILDKITRDFHDGPLPAKVVARNGKVRATWTVTDTQDSKGERAPQLSYSAVITSSSNAVVVRGKPVGYPQNWSGKGRCKTSSSSQFPKYLR